MTDVHHNYTGEMYAKFGYMATWVPNETLRLGDVSILQNRVFERITTLEQMKIPFEIRADLNPADYEYVSSDQVSIRQKAAGEAPLDGSCLSAADAGMSVRFSDTNAIVFQALRCVVTSILDQEELGRRILKLYDQELWPANQVIVTSLITSESATILISNGQDAQIELTIGTKLAPGGLINLVDTSLDLRVVHTSQVGTRIVAAKGLTPLFKVSGVKRQLFGRARFIRRGEEMPPAAGEAARETVADPRFVELSYDDCS